MRETTLSDSQTNVKAIFLWILGCGVLLGVTGSAFAGEIRDHRGESTWYLKGPPGYTFCAKQGERCRFLGMKDVAYGAYETNIPNRGFFIYKYGISGGIDCNDGTFGEDPLYGAKACYTKDSRDHRVDPVGPPGYTLCARYGQRCQFRGTADVAYGADGKFSYRRISNGIDCQEGWPFAFKEPAPNVAFSDHACYVKLLNVVPTPATPESPSVPIRDHRGDPVGPSGYTFCAKQGQRCHFRGTMDVAYGGYGRDKGHFAYKNGISGGIDCNDDAFGHVSLYGVVNACYTKDSRDHRYDPHGPPGYTFCAGYGQRCQFRGPADVALGADGKFSYKRISNGVDCKVDWSFNFKDPAAKIPFSELACYMKPIPATPAIPESRTVPTGPATSGPRGLIAPQPLPPKDVAAVLSQAAPPGPGLARGAQAPQVAALTNDALVAQVVERLKRQLPALQPKIQVSAAAGVVTLAGTVPSGADKGTAETVVKNVPGVTRVQNNLQVAAGLPGSGIQLQQQSPKR